MSNNVWLDALRKTSKKFQFVSKPRGQEVREIINYNYSVDMNSPVITHVGRKMNYPFMFAEAAWILRGRNDLGYITPFMMSYKNFSDDGQTLNGAYGPKVMDQISWAASELANDTDSRRCYVNIWRERPGPSKDIPCTTGVQFIIRDNALHMIVNMRSQDVVWGMPYDIFTFSAIAKYLQLFLYSVKKVGVSLGSLHVRAGSMHIYEHHYVDADQWLSETQSDNSPAREYHDICNTIDHDEFLTGLEYSANKMKEAA